MRFDEPLDDALASQGHVRILRALLAAPEGLQLSGRETARRAGLSHPRATAILHDLTRQGLVRAMRRARTDLFELNRAHALFVPLTSPFYWERGALETLASVIQAAIVGRTDAVEAAFLFGSVVWGGMAPDSDIDLAVISHSGKEEAISEALESVEERVEEFFGNHLAPLLIPIQELSARRRRSSLWRRILLDGHLVLGSRDSLLAKSAKDR